MAAARKDDWRKAAELLADCSLTFIQSYLLEHGSLSLITSVVSPTPSRSHLRRQPTKAECVEASDVVCDSEAAGV